MRFAQGSIHRHGVFNGDPHPGNYRFNQDGTVTFLDFGLVKRWSPGEFDRLGPVLDAILDADAERAVGTAVAAGFLPAGHGMDPAFVFEYIRGPYEPFETGSYWNAALPSNAAVDPSSSKILSFLATDDTYDYIRLPGVDDGSGHPIYWATSSTPEVKLTCTGWCAKATPSAVRIPSGANAANSSDSTVGRGRYSGS